MWTGRQGCVAAEIAGIRIHTLCRELGKQNCGWMGLPSPSYSWGAGVRERRALRVPKQTRSGHLPLTESKGREMGGGATRKGFVSGRPAPGGQRTHVSKAASTVPEVLPGSCQGSVE